MSTSVRCPQCGLVQIVGDDPGACLGCRFPLPAPASVDPFEAMRRVLAGAAQPAAAPDPHPPATLARGPHGGRRHLHWLLVLALIPLGAWLLTEAAEKSFDERLLETVRNLSVEERVAVIERVEELKRLKETLTRDDVLEILPRQRLSGALLGRSSNWHWVMAVASAVLFLGFFTVLAAGSGTRPTGVLGAGLFTATAGIGFLLLVQWLSSLVSFVGLRGGWLVAVLVLVLKLIAFSYYAALHPDNGFLPSFIGFTVGVGLCEELVKSIPVFADPEGDGVASDWRGLFVWGLASGAGFGIAEGVMYSGAHYNGVGGADVYLVRFVSCVALHAIWTGSVAILVFRAKSEGYFAFDRFERGTWAEWVVPFVYVVTVPAVLHGLYDTCLKKEMRESAVAVALVSFLYLALLLRRQARAGAAADPPARPAGAR
jgi:RsiW-degrading membrane proteinase PrsW (M82 family)